MWQTVRVGSFRRFGLIWRIYEEVYRAHESFSSFGVSLATRSSWISDGVTGGFFWKHALGSGLSWPEVSHPSRKAMKHHQMMAEKDRNVEGRAQRWIAHLESGLGETGCTFEPAERPEGEDPWTLGSCDVNCEGTRPRSRASQDATAMMPSQPKSSTPI